MGTYRLYQFGWTGILDIIQVVNIILGGYEANELELILAYVNTDDTINILNIITIANTIFIPWIYLQFLFPYK